MCQDPFSDTAYKQMGQLQNFVEFNGKLLLLWKAVHLAVPNAATKL